MKTRKVLAESKYFKLVYRRVDHKSWFEVKVDRWSTETAAMKNGFGYGHHIAEIQKYFDPENNKTYCSSKEAWRFWRRDVAEQNYLYAVMRWGNIGDNE